MPPPARRLQVATALVALVALVTLVDAGCGATKEACGDTACYMPHAKISAELKLPAGDALGKATVCWRDACAELALPDAGPGDRGARDRSLTNTGALAVDANTHDYGDGWTRIDADIRASILTPDGGVERPEPIDGDRFRLTAVDTAEGRSSTSSGTSPTRCPTAQGAKEPVSRAEGPSSRSRPNRGQGSRVKRSSARAS
jgi:hypothetical protein